MNSSWSEVFIESFRVFSEKFMDVVPGLLAAIVILVIGWLAAKLLSKGAEKLFEALKFDNLAETLKVTPFIKQANIALTPSQIIGRLVYWLFILLIIVSASEAMGWSTLSNEFTKILSYMPNLISAVFFFIIGTYIAAFIRDFIRGASSSLGISTGKIISSTVFYLLFIMIILTSLKQGGLNTSIIDANLLLIVGAVLLSAAISYGFASRKVLENILAGFFNKRTFYKGQIIEVDGIRGMIVEMTNISITIQVNEKEKMVIPSNLIMNSKIKILKSID
jgi:hypothetical protein